MEFTKGLYLLNYLCWEGLYQAAFYNSRLFLQQKPLRAILPCVRAVAPPSYILGYKMCSFFFVFCLDLKSSLVPLVQIAYLANGL